VVFSLFALAKTNGRRGGSPPFGLSHFFCHAPYSA
jgi:hypothetical protein